jgi:CBS domain-containing protein
MSLERFYKKDVVTVTPDTSLATVAEIMRARHVGSVVLIQDDRPIGVLTDRDIVVKGVAQKKDLAVTPASDLMTANPALINVNYDLLDAALIMRDHAVRRLPVVDENRRLLGILSLDYLLGYLGKEIADLAHAVQSGPGKEGMATGVPGDLLRPVLL